MSLAQSLACTKPNCPCQKTARTENGSTHCPVPTHGKGQGDSSPSLSFTTKEDGKELFNCKAGCTQAEIVDALTGKSHWKADPAPRPARRREEKAQAKKREWLATHAETLEYVSTKIRIDEPTGAGS